MSRRVRSETTAQPTEWIGGVLTPPFFVHDRDEPYRPSIAVWIELPTGEILGNEVVPPEAIVGAPGRLLQTILDSRSAGSHRRPSRIRVADQSLAADLRGVVGASIPVDVEATPELDALLEAMIEGIPGEEREASYLGDGRIPHGTVAELFTAAADLFRAAPWKTIDDDRVIRLDIPPLRVEGACVSIIGSLKQTRGFIVFPSLSGYEAFLDAVEEMEEQRGRGPIDLGEGWLALTFDRKADLPRTMRKEVTAHGWPVAGANAYPKIERRDPDGVERPLVARDLEIVTACARSLSVFYLEHRALFERAVALPVSESYFDDEDREVRFTFPYRAFALYEAAAGSSTASAAPSSTERMPKVGRNDPCPCGSGRKYKKCHLPIDEKARVPVHPIESTAELDQRLGLELAQFAIARFGEEWLQFDEDFLDPDHAETLAGAWALFHFELSRRPVVDWYVDENHRRLSERERAWLADQRRAWLSVWEVTAVDPGKSLGLRDLLSGETRFVLEESASQTLLLRDAVLARVVDHDGSALLCGVHPRPLPPFEAAAVVERARTRLRLRRDVPVGRLRAEPFGRYLIAAWEEEFDLLVDREVGLPEIPNSDGGERPAEAAQLELDFKQRHYSDWSDHPLPALGGKTPREAMRTRSGRLALDLLLKQMENDEQRYGQGGDVLFDFNQLRASLGLH
jgi:hypothetical protein